MFISAVILCLLALLLVCIYHSNKFVRIVGMYFVIIAINLVVGTLYLSRVTLYSAGNDMDYRLFTEINRLRLPHTTIVRIFNAAFSAYMLGAVLFVNYLKKIPWWGILGMLVPPIYLYIFNDPGVGKILHIEMNTSTGLRYQLLQQIVSWSNGWNKIMIMVYLLMPIAVIGIAYIQTVIWVRRKDLIVSGICLATINAFVYFGLINGIYHNIMFDNVNFVRLPLDYMHRNYSTVLPSIMWVAIVSIVLLIFFLKPYAILDKGNSFARKREWKQLNKNLGMILHSYKNAFLGISQQFTLAQININKAEYGKALANTEQGRKITSEYMASLENTLRFLKSVHVEFIPINLVDCIQNAMDRVAINNKNVLLELKCDAEKVMVKGDQYHITEMILNLLVNAVWAVEVKKTDAPHVVIKILAEEELVMLEVWDNGVGIEKKNRRKIFQPFFSTKSEASGGVGLNYVVNIIKQHRGRIRVQSIKGEYTSFQIVLPVYIQKVRIIQKVIERAFGNG